MQRGIEFFELLDHGGIDLLHLDIDVQLDKLVLRNELNLRKYTQ